MSIKSTALLATLVSVGSVVAQQGVTSPQKDTRPTGLRFFNNHLTIRPYVSLDYPPCH